MLRIIKPRQSIDFSAPSCHRLMCQATNLSCSCYYPKHKSRSFDATFGFRTWPPIHMRMPKVGMSIYIP